MSIYEYLSFREWLECWYTKKKEQNHNFSHRMLSRLCHQKSPSFFRDITTGRRNLTAEQEDILLKLLKMSLEEEAYFKDLVIFDQEPQLELRTRAFERISSARRIKASTRLEGEGYLYLSNWYYPAIRELACRPDFVADAGWISKELRPSVGTQEVQEALDVLQNMGMLEVEPTGKCTVKDVSITTPNQVTGLAVHQYHHQMLHLAQESIDRFTEEERHLLGVTVSIPASLLPQLKEELNQMAARLLDLCDGTTEEKDVTIQLGLHCFPLSKSRKENTTHNE